MATFADKLALIVTADTTSAVASIKTLGRETQTNLKKAETAGTGITGMFGKLSSLAPVAGMAVGAFGAVAVKAAMEGEAAQARLANAIANAGGTYGQYSGQISGTIDKMARLGFENDEVQNSIAKLIPATHSVNDAIKLQGLVADIARAKNIALADATDLVVKAQSGNARALRASGLITADQMKAISGNTDLVKLLAATYSGSAARSANTFAGQIRALNAEVHNLTESFGSLVTKELYPAVAGLNALVGPLATTSGHTKSLASYAYDASQTFLTFGLNKFGDWLTKASTGSSTLEKAQKDVVARTKEAVSATEQWGPKSAQAKAANDALAAATGNLTVQTAAYNNAATEGVNDTGLVTNAKQRETAATEAYRLALTAQGSTSEDIAAARQDMITATRVAAIVEHEVTKATNDAAMAAYFAVGGVISLAQAYQLLGQSANVDVASTFNNLSQAATTQFDATTKASDASYSFADAVANLTDKQSSAGGATKTATAAYYDQQQKLTALRDATQSIADSQDALTRAQRDQKSAMDDLKTATQSYYDVMHGVDKTSKSAKDAKDEVTSSYDAMVTANLDLRDAEGELNKVRKDRHHSPEELARAEVAVSEARLRAKKATDDYKEAQRVLNGTLHGFPAASAEAKAATKTLQDAQDKAKDAARGLRDANNQVHDSFINAGRAAADVQGKLDSVKTGAAQGQMKSLKQRIDDVKKAGVDMASAIGNQVAISTGSLTASVAMEIGVLRAIETAYPFLKGQYDPIIAMLNSGLMQLSPYFNFFKNALTGTPFAGLIPGTAEGGIATRAQMRIVGEAGPEAIIPLNRAGRVGGNSYTIHVSTLDARTAGSVVVDAIKSYEASNGRGWRN